MDVIDAGMVGVGLQLVVSLLMWWSRVRWQIRTEQQRGQLAIELVVHLQQAGGRVLEQRADGSVLELTVIGPYGDR